VAENGPDLHKGQDRTSGTFLKLKNAIDFFNTSLAKCSAGGDSRHDFMRANIEACVTALEECYERRDLADTSARLGGLSLTGASK
jgi:hypothetical protein